MHIAKLRKKIEPEPHDPQYLLDGAPDRVQVRGVRAWGAAVLALGIARSLAAQDPAASVDCDPHARTLVIRYTPELSEEKPAWPERPAPIHFYSLLDLDEAESTVVGTRSESVACRLGDDRFDVILVPAVPNPNLLGRCGAAYTGVVTVKRNGTVVLDEVEFEDLDCHDRRRMLVRIEFRSGEAQARLEHVAYE